MTDTGVRRPSLVPGFGIFPEKIISIPTMDTHGPPCFYLAGKDKHLALREPACGGVLALDGKWAAARNRSGGVLQREAVLGGHVRTLKSYFGDQCCPCSLHSADAWLVITAISAPG